MARKQKPDKRHLSLRGGVWYVQARMPDGRRIVQSTRTGDLAEARAVRDQLLEPLALTQERARLAAVQSAIGAVDQQLEQIADAVPATSIRFGWQAYLDQQNRPDSGPATLRLYEGFFEGFARWMEGEHPDVRELRGVTEDHAAAYAATLGARVSATTFNRGITTLALVWRVLERTARLTVNPWKGITRKRHTVHTRRELTIEELGRVCAAAQGEMRVLLALGIYCGLRLVDAALLRWSDVDMVKGVVSLIPAKTARRSGKRITLPMHPALLALLAETAPTERTGYVMPGLVERYGQFYGALSKDVSALFESVGIETSASIPGSTRKRPEAGFHSLRHTFVSLCAAGGVPQSVVQALVGHGSPAMTAHYTHIGLQTAQSAVACLPDVTGAAASPVAVKTVQGDLETVLALLERLDEPGLKLAAARARELSTAKMKK